MDEFVPKSQLTLFFATKKSVFNSPDCKHEIELSQAQNLPIIPIKGEDVSWSDLSAIGLDRQLGFEYDPSKFEEFCNKLYQYIVDFKHQIDLIDKIDTEIETLKFKIWKELEKSWKPKSTDVPRRCL